MDEKRMHQENMELKRKVAEANLFFKCSEKKAKPFGINSSFETPQLHTFARPPAIR